MRTRGIRWAIGAMAVSLVALGIGVARPADAATATPGVTRSTIKVGISMLDLTSVAQFTHGLTQGDFKGAYTALIKNLNDNGGINGRKLVPIFVNVSPLQSSSGAAACTQLTEDDKVFAVIGEFYGSNLSCYLQTHDTPVVGGTMTNQLLAAAQAPWFSIEPNDDVIEPAAAGAAAKAGVFTRKTVAVLAGPEVDPKVTAGVVRELKQDGVKPVLTATIQTSSSDSEAVLQQVSGVLAPKFQAAGVKVVVAVGSAVTLWADATGNGSYHPRLVATNYSDAVAATSGSTAANPAVIANAVTAYTKPLANQGKSVGWADPAIQKCAALARAAGVKFTNPAASKSDTDNSYVAVSQSCGIMDLFDAIVTKAGKNLTEAGFAKAGNSLGVVDIPAFGPGLYSKANPAGSFPLYAYRWNQASGHWIASARPSGTT